MSHVCSVQCFPTGHQASLAFTCQSILQFVITLSPLYSQDVEKRSGFFISLSPVLHTHLIFSRCSVDIYRMSGWVNAFWHKTSTSVQKDRLDGAEMGGNEIGQEHHTIAQERNIVSLNYICGNRISREEMDFVDLRKQN